MKLMATLLGRAPTPASVMAPVTAHDENHHNREATDNAADGSCGSGSAATVKTLRTFGKNRTKRMILADSWDTIRQRAAAPAIIGHVVLRDALVCPPRRSLTIRPCAFAVVQSWVHARMPRTRSCRRPMWADRRTAMRWPRAPRASAQCRDRAMLAKPHKVVAAAGFQRDPPEALAKAATTPAPRPR